jgi:hypothetical protein
LEDLVRKLRPSDLLVTFNWDVLVECALLRAGREFTYMPSKDCPNAVTVLKPYGSINWFALLDREMLEITSDSNLSVVGDHLANYLLYVRQPLSDIDFGNSSAAVRLSISRVPAGGAGRGQIPEPVRGTYQSCIEEIASHGVFYSATAVSCWDGSVLRRSARRLVGPIALCTD